MINTSAVDRVAMSHAQPGQSLAAAPKKNHGENAELREQFDSFVGETLFGQLLKSMRKTVGKPAYFHGGRTEEIFQQQLDQVLAEKITESSAATFTDPMFELFTLERR